MRPDEYEYFEYDNALFRKRADSGLSAVDDVWFPTGWTPYKGDRQEKFMFGDRIEPSQLPRRALDPITQNSSESGLIDLTEQSKGKAFQILSAPGKKPHDVNE